MPNRLELPDELRKLIEKRETPDRRAGEDNAAPQPAPPDTPPPQPDAAPANQRTGKDRRSGG